MLDKWFLWRGSKPRLGPFTFEQLRQLVELQRLLPSNLVLREGSNKWQPASTIKGLFDASANLAEVLPVVRVDSGPHEPQGRDKNKSWTLALALILVGILLVVGGVAIVFSLIAGTKAGAMIALFFLLILAIPCGIAGAVIGLINILSASSTCPKCERRSAIIQIEKKVIERKKCYGLVTRSAYTSLSGSVSLHGDRGATYSSGSTSWKERVPVIRTTYLHTYKCKFCNARWAEEEVKEVEDFDIER